MFSPDGMQILTSAQDKIIRLLSVETGEEISAFQGNDDWVSTKEFSADGIQVLTSFSDGTIHLWNTETNEENILVLGQGAGSGMIVDVSFSPDGRRILTNSGDGTPRIWDAHTGEEMIAFRGHEGWTVSAQLSPDGSRVMTDSIDNTIRLWDAVTGEELVVLRNHDGLVRPLSRPHSGRVRAVFGPDGQQFLSVSQDGNVRLWDGITGKPLSPVLQGHEGPVVGAQFSPDGSRILTISRDGYVGGGAVRMWSTSFDIEKLVSAAKSEVPRCLSPLQRTAVFLDPEVPSWCADLSRD